MRFEVIEAIEEYYKDDKDMLVECLVYLAHNENKNLAYLAQDKLEKMDRCCECGALLEPYTYEEHHTELCGSPIEYITEMLCPNGH